MKEFVTDHVCCVAACFGKEAVTGLGMDTGMQTGARTGSFTLSEVTLERQKYLF